MTAVFTYPAVFTFGGLAYALLELSWRGRTHWTMVIVGGFCVLLLYLITVKSCVSLWRKCIVGGAVITTVEFVSGTVINIVFDLGVWDYTALPFDLFGQVCLVYTLWWMLLSLPAILLLRYADVHIFNRGGTAFDAAGRYRA